jgi:anti-sigma regulatory factor (Ser/Thr protein kinase)
MIARSMDCDTLLVSQHDLEDNSIRCVYAWIEGKRVDETQLPVLTLAPEGLGMQSQVIRSGQPLRINTADEQKRTGSRLHYVDPDGSIGDEPGPAVTQSLLVAPILLDGRVLGVAQVMSLRPYAYTDAHLHFSQALLSQVAAASRNSYLYQQAQMELAERRRVEAENARLLREAQEAARQQRAFLRDVLWSVTEGCLRLCDTPDDLPTPQTWVTGPQELSAEMLSGLRTRVRDTALAQGLSEACWRDLVTAASEGAMNAIVHAGGGSARVAAGGGRVQVWVADTGGGIAVEQLPRATLERGYTTAGTFGHGFKMMLETADRIWLLTGPTGTTVVLEMGGPAD